MSLLRNRRCPYLYVLFCIGLHLAACTPDSPTPTPVAAVPLSTARWTATATVQLLPTTTPTVTDTNTPRPSPTRAPTISPLFAETEEFEITPLPSALPSRTATAVPTHYDIPAWVSDPEAAVLAALTYNDSRDYEELISIINVSTGERVIFPRPRFTSDLSWLETEEGVALQIYRWEGSGNVFNIPYRDTVSVATGNITSERLEVPWGAEPKSPDGTHIAYVLEDEATKTVHIKNVQTNQVVELVDPFDGRYPDHNELTWSPAGHLLMVLQYDFGEEQNDPSKFGLVIYTVNGDIYRSYADFYRSHWAPDNSYRLLYTAADETGNYRPCILDIQTNTTICIEGLTEWRTEREVETGWHQWFPDTSRISFVYWNQLGSTAGLCTMELATSEIACSIDEAILNPSQLGWGDSIFIIGYEWSADGRYLWLRLNPFAPGGDDGSYEQIATIAADGSQFYVWGNGHQAYWRPSLSP